MEALLGTEILFKKVLTHWSIKFTGWLLHWKTGLLKDENFGYLRKLWSSKTVM